jgi:hypothetical protein
MKRLGYVGLFAALLVLAASVNAWANTVPQPRDASLYLVYNDTADPFPSGGYSPYNNTQDIESNWYQDPASDTSPGFFQINDSTSTINSISASFSTRGASTDNTFTLTVSGTNATYASSYARLWNPEAGGNSAYSGTFTNYSYTFTATGLTTTTNGDWTIYNASSSNIPTSITGSFTGTFDYTADPSNLAGNGDTLAANLTFSDTLFDYNATGPDGWNSQYPQYLYGLPYSTFATSTDGGIIVDSDQFGYAGTVDVTPEPISMIFFGTGLVAVGGFVARRRMLRSA